MADSHATEQDKHVRESLCANISVTRAQGSVVEVRGEIPTHIIDRFREKVLRVRAQHISVPGFRKGHVPLSVIAKRTDPVELLRHTAEEVLAEAYPAMIRQHTLRVIGRPSINLTSIVPNAPVGFLIRAAIMPDIVLPDYRGIAERERQQAIAQDEVTVADEEVENVIDSIRHRSAHAAWHASHPDEHGHDHGDIPKNTWPPLTDEMAQKLGDFKDVAELRSRIREHIAKEKEARAKEKRRVALLEALLAHTTIDTPDILIENELEQMKREFNQQLVRHGLTMEEYLAHTKKSHDDVEREWRTNAEKRVKVQLLFNKIATVEGFEPDKEKVDRDVTHLLEHYPEADETRVRTYVEDIETHRLVFAFLEGGNDTLSSHS